MQMLAENAVQPDDPHRGIREHKADVQVVGQFEIRRYGVEHALRRAYGSPNPMRALAPEVKSTPYLSG